MRVERVVPSKATLPAGALLALAGLDLSGLSTGGGAATGIACAAILLFGLPHGTLDLAIIERERRPGRSGVLLLFAAYLGLAAAMLLAWSVSPAAALSSFVVIAVIHFAEDWTESGSTFLSRGMAAAILTAPTLLHRAELESIFVTLAGTSAAAPIADIMLLAAPASMLVACVTLAALWRSGERDQALAGAAVLATMVVAAPVMAFAAYFCLYHSPRHLGEALSRLNDRATARRVVPLLTCGALAIAGALFLFGPRADWSAQMVAASFKTLSLLTVPHMLVPAIVATLAARTVAVNPARTNFAGLGLGEAG